MAEEENWSGDKGYNILSLEDSQNMPNELLYESQAVSSSSDELTSEDRELLGDLYHLIISNRSEEETLANMKKEKYQRLLTVDIAAQKALRCECPQSFEGGLYFDIYNLEMVETMVRTGRCPHFDDMLVNQHLMSFQILHLAVMLNWTQVIKYLVCSCQANVNCLTGITRCSPVFLAVRSGFGDTAMYLLDIGANPNCDCFINTFLIQAMNSCCVRVMERVLCDKRYDINATNKDGETAFTVAVSSGSRNDIKMVLEAGCDISKRDSVQAALFRALLQREIDILALLVKAGAPLNLADDEGLCPLVFTVYQGDEEITQLLLEAGADPNCKSRDGYPALTIAAYSNEVEIVKLLIDHKADVNALNSDDYSALHFTAWDGYIDCVKLFLEAGASYDTKTRDGNTPLSLAAHGDQPCVIDILLPLGCDVRNTDKDLDTALHYAAFNGCLKTVVSMVEGGADLNARNACNATPLWNAVHQAHTDVVRFLVRKNVELNIPSRGINQHANRDTPVFVYDQPKTPLAIVFDSTWNGDCSLIEVLLIGGYDIWHEKWLTELTMLECSSPEVFTLLERVRSQVFTPPSLFHLCKMWLRSTHKLGLERFLGEQEIPATLTSNITLEGIDRSSRRLSLQTFGKIF